MFNTKTFWQSYFSLEFAGIEESGIVAILDGFRADFAVRDKTVHFKVYGKPASSTLHFVEFPFFCGERFSMIVEFEPSVQGCDINLFLVDNRSETRFQMGWWDLARWHPYCLRSEELDLLLRFWERNDPRWREPELPLLLLCPFVGFADAGSRDIMLARAEVSLRRLGLSVPSEDQPEIRLNVPDDYRWECDPEFGWCFTSDEYSCYSIRNRDHAGSGEGDFPFRSFQEMMADIER
jgi:hypothetical protein